MPSDAAEVGAVHIQLQGLAAQGQIIAACFGGRGISAFAVLVFAPCGSAGVGSGLMLPGGFSTGGASRYNALDLLHKSHCPARIRNPGLLQSDRLPSQTEDHSRRSSSSVCEGRQLHLKGPALPVQDTYARGLLSECFSAWVQQGHLCKP